MEKRVKAIVFRRLTFADFSHINKSGSAYDEGGGQSYIDFPTKNVSLDDWSFLLGEATGMATGRPVWEINMNSLGLNAPIFIENLQPSPHDCLHYLSKIGEWEV